MEQEKLGKLYRNLRKLINPLYTFSDFTIESKSEKKESYYKDALTLGKCIELIMQGDIPGGVTSLYEKLNISANDIFEHSQLLGVPKETQNKYLQYVMISCVASRLNLYDWDLSDLDWDRSHLSLQNEGFAKMISSFLSKDIQTQMDDIIMEKDPEKLTMEEIEDLKNKNSDERLKQVRKKLTDMDVTKPFDTTDNSEAMLQMKKIVSNLTKVAASFQQSSNPESLIYKTNKIIDEVNETISESEKNSSIRINPNEDKYKVMFGIARIYNLLAKIDPDNKEKGNKENNYYAKKNEILSCFIEKSKDGEWPMGYLPPENQNSNPSFGILMPKKRTNEKGKEVDYCIFASLHCPALRDNDNKKNCKRFPINIEKDEKFLTVKIEEVKKYVLGDNPYEINVDELIPKKEKLSAEEYKALQNKYINDELQKRINFFGGLCSLRKKFGVNIFTTKEVGKYSLKIGKNTFVRCLHKNIPDNSGNSDHLNEDID